MPFQGQRGTEDHQVFNSDTGLYEPGGGISRPYSWREGILRLFPNGMAPLTGLTAKMSSESTTDPNFHWFTELFPLCSGAIIPAAPGPPITAGIYTNAAMTTPYVGGGVAGNHLYINVAEELATFFREGHQALLRLTTDPTADVNVKVTTSLLAGVSSVITVRLLEDDDNSLAVPPNNLTTADWILVIGNINPEGSAMPTAIASDPTHFQNCTQIFRNALDITRTARKTKMRTGDAYLTEKMRALEQHSVEMEKAFLWGIRSLNTGANGKPERTTMGLAPFIRGYGGLISDFSTALTVNDEVPVGNTFRQSGGDWLDWCFMKIFRWGGQKRTGFIGAGAAQNLNAYIKNTGSASYMLSPTTTAYGIKVLKWVTVHGEIDLITHPLFSYEPTNTYTMIVFDPSDLKYRYIDDTQFFPDNAKQNTGHSRVDGTKEDWLTEAGLEFHHPIKCAYLTGFNGVRV